MLELLVHFGFDTLKASGPYSSDYIGSVGNLIAAVLQTAGLYGQTDVLLFYQDALRSIAGLLYVFSIAAAITSVAVFGNYRNGAYFLIGPLLFYSMLTGVTTAKPTAVQVGTRLEEGAEQVQQQLLSAFLDEDSEIYTREIKLSWFFVMFDNLVTNVSQNIISVLLDEENSQDVVNMARERGLVEVLGARNTDRNLYELANIALVGECSEAMSKYLHAAKPEIREAADGTKKAEIRNDLIAEANKRLVVENLNLPKSLLTRLSQEVTQQRLSTVPIFAQNAGESWNTLVSKQVHSCFDVWSMVRVLSHLQANDKIEEIKNRENADPTGHEVSWSKVVEDIERTFGPEMTEADRRRVLNEMMSQSVFKDALRNTNHATLMRQIDSHVNLNQDGQVFDDVLGGYYSIEGQGALARLAMFTGIIPYLQGLFLFVLATAFPFFCIFLVMPGRATSFLTWLWLWVWVKSWDIGFATIHIIRDVLWDWLGKASYPFLDKSVPIMAAPAEIAPESSTTMADFLMKVEYTALDWNDPSAVLHSIVQGDPMANIHTYYILISLITISVPLLTAHLCRGAGQILSAFQQSFEGISDNFGRTYNNRMEQYSANAMNDHLNQATTAYALAETKKFIQQNGGDDPQAKRVMGAISDAISGNNPSKLSNMGDGALATAASAYYMKARADYLYSDQSTSLQGTRGMFTARPTLWDLGYGQGHYSGMDMADLAIQTLQQNALGAGKNILSDLNPGVKPGEFSGGSAGQGEKGVAKAAGADSAGD